MHIRFFKHHWIFEAGAPDKRLPEEALPFWEAAIPKGSPAKGAIIAYHKGIMVGFFRWEHLYRNGKGLWALGTWVAESQRGKGLAYKMWVKALTKTKARSVHVTAVSKGGRHLVDKVQAQFPDIDWEIDF